MEVRHVIDVDDVRHGEDYSWTHSLHVCCSGVGGDDELAHPGHHERHEVAGRGGGGPQPFFGAWVRRRRIGFIKLYLTAKHTGRKIIKNERIPAVGLPPTEM